MKQVVSVSLGSATRDFVEEATFLGEPFLLRRVGTDGDYAKYNALLREWDGVADALCLGGIDRYVWSDGKQYEFKDAKRLIAGVVKSPIVDGSGLKNPLERETIRALAASGTVDFAASKTLMVCGVDRFGMSEALVAAGGAVVFGDFMFSLEVPIAIKTWARHRFAARTLLPILTQLPFKWLYPTGDSQTKTTPKWGAWYDWADIIAGDFLLIRRFLPDADNSLRGKVVITNTTTNADRAELKRRGVRLLVTSTPRFNGRSPGTNVMEGVFVALNGGKPLDESGYREMLSRLQWTPTVEEL